MITIHTLIIILSSPNISKNKMMQLKLMKQQGCR